MGIVVSLAQTVGRGQVGAVCVKAASGPEARSVACGSEGTPPGSRLQIDLERPEGDRGEPVRSIWSWRHSATRGECTWRGGFRHERQVRPGFDGRKARSALGWLWPKGVVWLARQCGGAAVRMHPTTPATREVRVSTGIGLHAFRLRNRGIQASGALRGPCIGGAHQEGKGDAPVGYVSINAIRRSCLCYV